MFDIHHDSPVPIHEQLTGQIRAHIASEALKAGAILKEYRALAQELLANPQVVARAYAELTADGVLKTMPDGGMAVTAQAGGDLPASPPAKCPRNPSQCRHTLP